MNAIKKEYKKLSKDEKMIAKTAAIVAMAFMIYKLSGDMMLGVAVAGLALYKYVDALVAAAVVAAAVATGGLADLEALKAKVMAWIKYIEGKL